MLFYKQPKNSGDVLINLSKYLNELEDISLQTSQQYHYSGYSVENDSRNYFKTCPLGLLFKDKEQYSKGDIVQFSGSYWNATGIIHFILPKKIY